MGERKKILNQYAQRMADITISRNPLRKSIFVEYRDKDYDQYLDVRARQNARYWKQAIVKKNPDLSYVAETFDTLIDDTDTLPWIVTITQTGLPHNPQHEDLIIIDGQRYVIAQVKPVNRDLEVLISCLVYPDRDEVEDRIAVYKVTFRKDLTPLSLEEARGSFCCMDIIYGGNPLEMSFDEKTWLDFGRQTIQSIPEDAEILYIKDSENREVAFDLVNQVEIHPQ